MAYESVTLWVKIALPLIFVSLMWQQEYIGAYGTTESGAGMHVTALIVTGCSLVCACLQAIGGEDKKHLKILNIVLAMVGGALCLLGAIINRSDRSGMAIYFSIMFFAALKAILAGVFFILDLVGVGAP